MLRNSTKQINPSKPTACAWDPLVPLFSILSFVPDRSVVTPFTALTPLGWLCPQGTSYSRPGGRGELPGQTGAGHCQTALWRSNCSTGAGPKKAPAAATAAAAVSSGKEGPQSPQHGRSEQTRGNPSTRQHDPQSDTTNLLLWHPRFSFDRPLCLQRETSDKLLRNMFCVVFF